MYDIRQFKPALYVLLFIGLSGFALAAQWPGVWFLSVGGLGLNAWLVKTRRFTPELWRPSQLHICRSSSYTIQSYGK